MKKNCFLMVFIFITFLSSQVFAANISGTISFASTKPSTGHLWIEYAPTTGPSCTAADWWNNRTPVDMGVVSFPYSYNITPPNGSYCIGAYVDNPPIGPIPDLMDPAGIHSVNAGQLKTVVAMPNASGIDMTLYDPGNLSGNWSLTVNVDVAGVGTSVDCVYTGSVGTGHIAPNSLLFGGGPITASTGTLCPTFLDMFFFCDVSTDPINCSLVGAPSNPPDSPYTSQGNITNGGNTISGSFQGSAGTSNYSAEWTLNKISTSIPTLTQWGMIIFVVLAGFGAAFYLRRQRRSER